MVLAYPECLSLVVLLVAVGLQGMGAWNDLHMDARDALVRAGVADVAGFDDLV